MLAKIILTAGLFVAMSTSYVNASSVTITTPADLAKQQEILSEKLISNYDKHKDISQTLERLKEKQERLKGTINSSELNNLLNFLELCLKDIKSINAQPHNHSNSQRIADLGTSISEGSRYIANSLQ